MQRRTLLQLGGGALLSVPLKARPAPPNIVVILTDDLGYGDLSCYGATRVRTPHLDRLAAQGLRFTDGHSSAATCTPTRYSLLTGEYAWRKKGTGVLPGSAALIIDSARPTLPSILRQAGYTTGCVGKWHLGLGSGDVDWNGDIRPGPLEVGFDYSFIIPATGDRVPCVYVENRRVVGLDPKDPIQVSYGQPIGNEPTGRDHPGLLKLKPSHGHDQTIVNGISRIGYMSGGKAARWVDEDMGDVVTRKAVSFLERSKDRPFFLYFCTHDVHVPRVPHPRFHGSSQCGVRCDTVSQLDWCVGEVLGALRRLGQERNTLVIFTSDNGPVVDDGYQDGAVETLGSHRPAGPLRGGKYSNFEGGTRVPWLARWPARIKPGISDALVGQIDLMASLATLTGQTLSADAAPDSFDILSALLGESKRGREHLVEQARSLSLRLGQWKLIGPSPGPAINRNTNTEMGTGPEPQLYDLAADLGETRNLAAQHPDKVKEMLALLGKIRAAGRSRP
jgi:arylsulfatase A-like enzyme